MTTYKTTINISGFVSKRGSGFNSMAEKNGKSQVRTAKTSKKCKKRRPLSKSESSDSSSSKGSTTKVPTNSKRRGKKHAKTKSDSSPGERLTTSSHESTISDSADISALTSSFESDRRSSASFDVPRLTRGAKKSCQPGYGKRVTGPKEATKSVNEATTSAIEMWTNINEETMRWNGICDNPDNEEKRLEVYKANRRKRYYEQAKARAGISRYYATVKTA